MNPTQGGNPAAALGLIKQMGQTQQGLGAQSGQSISGQPGGMPGSTKSFIPDLTTVIKVLDGYANQSQDPDVIPIVKSIIILVAELIKDEQQKSMGDAEGQGQPGMGSDIENQSMGGQGGMGMMGGGMPGM